MGLSKVQERLITQLYRDMYTSLCIYALSALNDRPLAEEAVQDTFRIACAKADHLFSSNNPKGWLIKTLKNVICNIRRSRSRLNNLVISVLSVDEISVPSQDGEAGFNVMYSELFGQDDFELLKMIILSKYTMLEASSKLGISLEACKKRVQRAKKKCKKLLEGNL